MSESKRLLSDLEVELAGARNQYEEARERASVASREETIALNRLNQAQKAFDERVRELRAEAPARSDWGNRRTRAQSTE